MSGRFLQITLLFLLLVPGQRSLLMAGEVYISVGEAKIKKVVLAFPETKYEGAQAPALASFLVTARELLVHDLEFTNLFAMQPPSAFIETGGGITLETFKMTDWSSIGSEFVLKTAISQTGTNIQLEARLFDVVGKKQVFAKKYLAKPGEPKFLAHSLGNDIVEALTGKRGFFFTKLAMVCDKTGSKEIWIADYDGSNPKQLTRHKSLAFAPAWNHDGTRVAYSLYTKNSKNVKNIDLYEFNFSTQKARLLSNRTGINSGAAYHPDGKRLVLTMSFLGNPEIFTLDPDKNQATRVTSSLGVDVDPVFSPDGKKLAYVSTRTSQPMVYVSNADGTNADRITFAGVYNATPRWHPSGTKLAFAGYLEKHFDLFLVNTDKSNLERLTKNEGNNEDPDFAPDGSMLVFSSNRTGQKNVYVISIDGQFTRRLTYGLGNCTAPRWSPYEKP